MQKQLETEKEHTNESPPAKNEVKWRRIIRQLPSGFGTALGFITTIIAFVVAFQESFHLSVVISLMCLLVALFLLLVYLAFDGVLPFLGEKRKAGQRYRVVRPWALVGLVMVPALAILTLLWKPSRSFVATAVRGTPTPTATATSTPTMTSTPTVPPTATSTATPTPQPEVLRITVGYPELDESICCTEPVLIPDSIEPSEVKSVEMPAAAWVNNGLFLNHSFAELIVTSLADKEWIKISNKIMARVVSHTALPGPIDFATLYGCGGVGTARYFPLIEIDTSQPASASIPAIDFFTLQSGEIEVFRVELGAIEPGLYEIELGVEYTYQGTTSELWTSQTVPLYAPESYHLWHNNGMYERLEKYSSGEF